MFFFFKQKTAYEMRISDWSSDVCSSDLNAAGILLDAARHFAERTAVLEAHEVRTTSFAELWGGALALARRLQCAGIRPGDRVAIQIGRASCRERVCQSV